MVEIHPDVQNTLQYAASVQDHLLSHLEKMRALTAERLSEDREIAVKVDALGQLTALWLKPGILDRQTAAAIAKEITRLINVAGQQSSAGLAELYHAAHQLPEFENSAPAGDQDAPRAGG